MFGSSSDPLPPFTNAPVQEEMGPYLIPVEFKDEQNDTDFTELISSPNKACLSGLDSVESSSTSNVFLQQVKFSCELELMNGPSFLNADIFVLAEPVFNLLNGRSYCQLYPTDDQEAVKVLSTMDRLRLILKVKASDFKEQYDVWSEGLEIPFSPAFSVDIGEVLLTPESPSVNIKVSGLPTVLNSIQV